MSIRTTTPQEANARPATTPAVSTAGGILQVIKYRYWYFGFSLAIIIPGLIFLAMGGLKLGIDFTGGTEMDIQFPAHPKVALSDAGIMSVLNVNGLQHSEIQRSITASGTNTYLIRTPYIGNNQALRKKVVAALFAKYGTGLLKDVNSVGATVGQEIQGRAALAVLAASVVILGYITLAFRKMPHPVRYGVCAITALLHDVLVVLGIFAILGKLFGITIDSLFITALLTVIGFSVHDTIVIFDRIRENISRRTGEPFPTVVNNAILQSLARSLNTSITVLLTLLALVLFGGESIRIFVLTLLIGITSGTYSSIFNASPLLVVWETGELGRFLGRRGASAGSPKGTPPMVSTAARG
jgi:preprotein translocase subunit SecF